MIDELTMQKCVDGELSPAEQREFLTIIESNQGGWRTLALAYIEEQTWKTVLSIPPLASEHSVKSTCAPTRMDGPQISRATMALGLLVALTAGLLVGDMWGSFHNGASVAMNRDTNRTGSSTARPDSSGLRASQQLSQQSTQAPAAHYVMDVVDANGQPRQMTYPVYESPPADADWQPHMPADLEDRLLRYGYQIERQQRFQMIPLADGGQLAFPIELIRAQPIQ